jgi:hypothetical protein
LSALPTAWLQAILGRFVLLVSWMLNLGRLGAERGIAVLGFGAIFLGVFVSATGTLLAPFVASASPTRQVHAATLGALMTFSHIAKLIAFRVHRLCGRQLRAADDGHDRRWSRWQLARRSRSSSHLRTADFVSCCAPF